MPIKIPNGLPATETLQSENIFVINETRAITQDIRPLKILLLNLMPTKIVTETQFARLLGNSPLQVEFDFINTATHNSKNTSVAHLAGALGVKTFLMIPFASDWRWFEDKEKTAWYDSIEIFKQTDTISWEKPIEDITCKLKEYSS